MRISDVRAQILELEIVGYQFPDEASRLASRERAKVAGIQAALVPRNKHDDNWLMVRGYVETDRGRWDFLEPCLDTWEAQELVGWLRGASSGERRGTLGFTEPVLEFATATPEPGGRTVKVVANFGLEGRPPWVSSETFEQSPVEFVFTTEALAEAALTLERELASYPVR